MSVIGSMLFFALAPVTVAGLIPRFISNWRFETLPAWMLPAQVFGGLLIAFGTVVLLDSFARFALQGLGTPAPVFPTKHLVVTGLYRYVRNPMYVAVVSAIAGQSLLFGNFSLLENGAIVWLAFHLFVFTYEEPTLKESFGREYADYQDAVPLWIPRLNPWRH